MNRDENFIAKLWLEETKQYEEAPSSSYYRVKKRIFTKKQIQSIEIFCKKNHIAWDILVHAAWGLLLNRFSTTDYITYATANLHTQLKSLTTEHSPFVVESTIADKISIKMFIQTIKSQLDKKRTKKNLSQAQRYLLLFQTRNKKKKTSYPVEINQFSLVLLAKQFAIENISIFYNQTLFSKRNIECILEHFMLILEEISRDTAQKTTQFNLLTKKEKQKLLVDWSEATYNFPIPTLQGCTHELFAKYAKR